MIRLAIAVLVALVAGTPLGQETPETRDPNRDLDGVIQTLAEALPEPSSVASGG